MRIGVSTDRSDFPSPDVPAEQNPIDIGLQPIPAAERRFEPTEDDNLVAVEGGYSQRTRELLARARDLLNPQVLPTRQPIYQPVDNPYLPTSER